MPPTSLGVQPFSSPVVEPRSADPDPRFAALVHSTTVADIVRAEARREGHNVRVLVTTMETALDDAEVLLRDGSDVLLCHGHCRHTVYTHFSKVTVSIDRSDFSIMQALQKARVHAREVMFTAHEEEAWDVAAMEQLLDMRIHLISYNQREDMIQQMERLYADGVHVAVGGGVTSRVMAGFGGLTVLDEPSSTNIRNAFDRAVALAASNQREAAHVADLMHIMQHIREGVVCVNSQRELLFCNERARELLHASDTSHLAKHYNTLLIDDVLENKEPFSDVLVRYGNERLLVSTFPLARHAGGYGAMSFFHDMQSLQKINRKIGDELYARGFTTRYTLGSIKGKSPLVHKLLERIRRYAPTEATVFITGETGTGKELVAHALHNESLRRDRPFVAVNCAALPENLLESELFGYDEGAFTGARRGGKAGLFELADKGTLFLDEIGDISPSMQLRLLRVLETREVMRVGGDRFVRLDVRIISASHASLAQRVRQNTLRLDLYYRLAGLRLHLPPLRERLEDIPLLLQPLLDAHRAPPSVLTADMHAQLRQRAWPGNVRELFAIVGAYLSLLLDPKPDKSLFADVLADYESLDAPQKEPQKASQTVPSASPFSLSPSASFKTRLASFKRQAALEALALCAQNKDLAARHLGVSLSTLHRMLEIPENNDDTVPMSLE